jgi:hypothetical protein
MVLDSGAERLRPHGAKAIGATPASREATPQTIPSSNAFNTARVRSRTPSLERMFET